MMLPSSRPSGSRLYRIFAGKLKIMNFTVLPDDYSWASMWGRSYSASRNLQWLQTAKAAGFNTIRVFAYNGPPETPPSGGNQTISSWPSVSIFTQRAAEFSQQCRSLGLMIMVTSGGSATTLAGPDGSQIANNLPGILAYMKVWAVVASDLLVSFDLINEMDFQPPSSWGTTGGTPTNTCYSDLSAYVAAARAAVPGVPITVSITPNNDNYGSYPWIDLQYALSLDYHDIHRYNSVASPTPYLALEQRSKFLGLYIVGESGIPQSNSDAGIRSWMNALGDVARRPLCKGVGMWCITPQGPVGGSNDFGLTSDVAGTQVRTTQAAAVSSWVANL